MRYLLGYLIVLATEAVGLLLSPHGSFGLLVLSALVAVFIGGTLSCISSDLQRIGGFIFFCGLSLLLLGLAYAIDWKQAPGEGSTNPLDIATKWTTMPLVIMAAFAMWSDRLRNEDRGAISTICNAGFAACVFLLGFAHGVELQHPARTAYFLFGVQVICACLGSLRHKTDIRSRYSGLERGYEAEPDPTTFS